MFSLRACRKSMARGASLAALGCAMAFAVHASPEAEADPLSQLLVDHVMADMAARPQTEPSFAQQMRYSASDMVLTAMTFLGVRYRRGGNNAEDGFDCSGFTRYVFENSLGLMLPRRADEQANAPGLRKVHRDDLQPGDLVFFNTLRRTFSHVGIYVGEGKFIHAPRSGANVRIEDIGVSYWAKRFTGARRPEAGGLVSTSSSAVSRGRQTSLAVPAAASSPVRGETAVIEPYYFSP
jgi:cell wall-associated NlpC family hydrolase